MFTDKRTSSTHGAIGTIIRTTSSTDEAATQTCDVAAIRSITLGRAGTAVATSRRSPLLDSSAERALGLSASRRFFLCRAPRKPRFYAPSHSEPVEEPRGRSSDAAVATEREGRWRALDCA